MPSRGAYLSQTRSTALCPSGAACRGQSVLPVRMLLCDHGDRMFAAVPAKLRCQKCGKPPARRWCTWPVAGRDDPNPKLLCDDRLATDGIRASGRQHPVQHRHADGSLGLLGREAAGSQPRSDQRLVTTHCRFY